MILVTGGAGYIGSIMTRKLCDQGLSVVVLDDLSTGFKEHVDSRARLVKGDLTDELFIADFCKSHSFDSVFHFAAKIKVEESVKKPELYHQVNTRGTETLARALTHHSKKLSRFVFSSTASVYGIPQTVPVRESDRTLPINPYGESKLNAEKALRSIFSGTKTSLLILRYFNVAGASVDLTLGQRDRDATHLIKSACQVAIGQRPELPVYGDDYPTRDGTCERDFIHVEDLVDLHFRLWDKAATAPASEVTINCGYGRPYSVLEVIQALERIAQKKIPVRHAPRRAGDPPSVYADISRLKEALKWSPRFDSLDTILKSAYDWEKITQ